jgi:Protein of unknown function (DUF1552)
MQPTDRAMSRRSVLRGMMNGAVVTVSLPLLDVFLNSNGTAMANGAPLPLRFGTWFWGLGADHGIFTPKTTGEGYELPPQMAALAPVKEHVNVFTNFNVFNDGRPNLCHYSGWVALRCGSAPVSRASRPSQTLDCAISDRIGAGSPYSFLNLAATGQPRDSLSFRDADTVNPADISALDFYQKIFGSDFHDPNLSSFTPDPRTMVRKSVLSSVREQSKSIEQILGAADRARLDQYYTAVRELENRLALQLEKPPAVPSCKLPKGAPKEIPIGLDVERVAERHRAMVDVLVMALACNQTRVFNMVYSDSGSSLTRNGQDKTHHAFTHEEPMDPVLGYQPNSAWFVGRAMEAWAYLVKALAGTPEGDGSLLDHSLIYANSDCLSAKTHSVTGIPMFTAGRLNGRVKAGLHVDGKGEPGTRLGYTIQRLFGVPLASWGTQSMETSRELGEMLA